MSNTIQTLLREAIANQMAELYTKFDIMGRGYRAYHQEEKTPPDHLHPEAAEWWRDGWNIAQEEAAQDQ